MRVGFIGLGAMGSHMARNLHRAGPAGRRLESHAREGPRSRRRARHHRRRTLPRSSARLVDAIVLCVSADQDVLDVVTALARASPERARHGLLHRQRRNRAPCGGSRCTRGTSSFLDCPVSGGVEGARDATLAIMVGGSRDAFERAQPVLAALGKTVTHFGPTAAARPPRPPTRSCAPASSRRSPKRWPLPRAQGLPLDKRGRHARQGRGLELVLRASRAEHGPRHATPPASACACMRRISASAATWPRASASRCRWSSACSTNTPSS